MSIIRLKKKQLHVISAVTFGNALEWYQAYSYIYLAPVISKLFFNSISHETNLFFTFIVFGIGYNLLFMNEYLFGALWGSVDKVAKETIQYVNLNPAVKGVITYYDIGAYGLHLSGKYYSRFYTAPKRDYTPKIEAYRGQYMIVDFPAIDK